MRSRALREGSVGLLILVGLGLMGGLILWLRGLDLGKRSYRFVIDFADASGMQAGSPVRFRGVPVGQIREVQVGTGTAQVEVEISSATLLIPRNSIIQSNQAGLIGETTVDIVPNQNLPPNLSTNPLAENCPGSPIVCDGDRLQGLVGVNFNELITATVKLTDLFADPELFSNIRSLTRNSADAAAGVANLTNRVSSLTTTVEQELKTLSASANRTTIAAGRTADQIGSAAAQFGLTANQFNQLLLENRTALSTTLNNVSVTSNELRRTAINLSSTLEQGEFIRNLETLSANAAEASASLRDVSRGLASSENLLMLQQTLDSARATFQNAQKITADLDELTGDPRFRQNIRNLIDGLNNLVSSTQQLQQQTELARAIAPTADSVSQPTPAPAPAMPLRNPRISRSLRLHPYTPPPPAPVESQTSELEAVPQPRTENATSSPPNERDRVR